MDVDCGMMGDDWDQKDGKKPGSQVEPSPENSNGIHPTVPDSVDPGFIGVQSSGSSDPSPTIPDSDADTQKYGLIGLQTSPEESIEPGLKKRQKRRHETGTPVVAPAAPANERRAITTVIASVFDIIVENGSGSVIGEATVNSLPSATDPSVFSIPDFGSVTIPPQASLTPAAASPSSPAAVSSPLPTPSSTLSIQLPNASSQVVLTESPSTPLPSGSSMSLPPPNTTASPSVSNNGTIVPFAISSLSRTTTNGLLSSSQSTLLSQTGLATLSSSIGALSGSHTGSPTNSRSGTSSVTGTAGSSSYTGGLISTPTGNGAGGSSPSGTGAAPGSSSTSGAGAVKSNSVTVPVVGGVVGGLAGMAVILVLLLMLLRWRRRKLAGTRDIGSSADTETARPTTDDSRAAMAQNPSSTPWAAAGIMPMLKKMRPHSQTTATTETAPSERGFQKISGRKLPSVLHSGGDGYGGGPGPSGGMPPSVAPPAGIRNLDDRNLSMTSFYRDSQGTYGGTASPEPPGDMEPTNTTNMMAGAAHELPGSPGPPPPRSAGRAGVPYPTLATSPPSESPSPPPNLSESPPDVVVMRPGPARRPTHSPGFGTPPISLTPPPTRFRDGIGRSHPSFDGSRGSRGSRFAEDI